MVAFSTQGRMDGTRLIIHENAWGLRGGFHLFGNVSKIDSELKNLNPYATSPFPECSKQGKQMAIITLLTDFGLKDGYPGVMKGVIWSIAPAVQIADITHSIPPQDVRQGALALARSYGYFPAGSIHVAVVDPGVGTRRRPLALRVGENFFVGPDNGLFTLVLERSEASRAHVEIIHLDRPEYWLPEVSRVFHGRDIFAPVAAHLANGVPLEALGHAINDPQRLSLPRPQPLPGGGWRGEVIAVDHFGNLSTNLERSLLSGMRVGILRIADHRINGLVTTFGERPPGELIALFGTSDDLVISVVNGSAADLLHVGVGEAVEVYPA